MAQVDFTNAVIEPYINNPLSRSRLSLDANAIYALDGSADIISGLSVQYSNTKTSINATYTGTFTASGTGFRILQAETHWRVTNVSFSAGDTLYLTIRADLICQ